MSDSLKFKEYLRLAEQGDSQAQAEVGYAYEYGVGVELNYQQAFSWYFQSMNNGNYNGLVSIARCFELGRGVRKNIPLAVGYYMLYLERHDNKNLQDDVFNLMAEMQNIIKKLEYLKNAKWLTVNNVINTRSSKYSNDFDFLTDKFYISSYECPKCAKAIYKGVFPIGREYEIATNNGMVRLKRVFTCPNSRTFYAPISGSYLNDGKYHCLELSNEDEYSGMLYLLSISATLEGRQDL